MRYKRRCEECIRAGLDSRRNKHRKEYLKHKKSYCEDCGFVAAHPVQLDIDHIDGDKFNNAPENLKTLCSNCHRLKGLKNGDFTKWAKREEPQGQLFDRSRH